MDSSAPDAASVSASSDWFCAAAPLSVLLCAPLGYNTHSAASQSHVLAEDETHTGEQLKNLRGVLSISGFGGTAAATLRVVLLLEECLESKGAAGGRRGAHHDYDCFSSRYRLQPSP
ncbi:unnamed protein product [Lota lota]